MRYIINYPQFNAALPWNPSISSPSNWRKPLHFLLTFPVLPTILGWLHHLLVSEALYTEKGSIHTLSSGLAHSSSQEAGFPSGQPFSKITVITSSSPRIISSPFTPALFLPREPCGGNGTFSSCNTSLQAGHGALGKQVSSVPHGRFPMRLLFTHPYRNYTSMAIKKTQ